MTRFRHPADYQRIADWARAELRALDGIVSVEMTDEGAKAIARIRTELLAFLGDAALAKEAAR